MVEGVNLKPHGIFTSRAHNLDIDMVYPRLFMSNYSTARNIEAINHHGITHILTVCPYANPQFPTKC
jgi:hypothetical protein